MRTTADPQEAMQRDEGARAPDNTDDLSLALALVQRYARHFVRRYNGRYPLSDFLAAGYMAIGEALAAYDRRRPFLKFLSVHVFWEMQDVHRYSLGFVGNHFQAANTYVLVSDVLSNIPSPSSTDAADPVFSQWLARHWNVLTPTQQHCLRRYYWYEWTYQQIGQELGVSTPRVCQILGAALRTLRTQLISSAPQRKRSSHSAFRLCSLRHKRL